MGEGQVSWRTRAVGALLAALIGVGATGCAAVQPSTQPVTLVGAGSDGRVEPRATPTPVPVVSRVVETEPVAFERVAADDPNLPRGQVVVTPGVDGVRTLTYEVTTLGGRETARTVVSDVVTTAAVAELTTTGTFDPPAPAAVAAPAASGCDASYADACVPIDSDVDCAGGSGNGPSYLDGQARVVGTDHYDLDRDDNGIACD